MAILVTGTAGFIGFHVAKKLLADGHKVIGIDNLNNYYSTKLKHARLDILKKEKNFTFYKFNISNRKVMEEFAKKYKNKITEIIHLAAQAGVRHSIKSPYSYLESNLSGQLVMLELCRSLNKLNQFIYASSSSVYGGNKKIPFSVDDRTDDPISLYAASKKSGELMAHSYSHLYGINATGLRFFTVYGPWGRPDMAYFIFTKAIDESKPIELFNSGKMKRDFTYIDDVVGAIISCIGNPKLKGHNVYNIGNNNPSEITDLIKIIENAIGKTAIIKNKPMQPGDVEATFADIEKSRKDIGFMPRTTLQNGMRKFIEWYIDNKKL